MITSFRSRRLLSANVLTGFNFYTFLSLYFACFGWLSASVLCCFVEIMRCTDSKVCRCKLFTYFIRKKCVGLRSEVRQCCQPLASESQCKGSSAPSDRSLALDKERMKPGHWLGSVLCVPFSVLTLLIGWQEGHPTIEILLVPAHPGSPWQRAAKWLLLFCYPQRVCFGTVVGGGLKRDCCPCWTHIVDVLSIPCWPVSPLMVESCIWKLFLANMNPLKISQRSSRGTPPPGELNTRGVAKYSYFGPIDGYISETVQDRM